SDDTVEVLPQNVAVISGRDYASSNFDVRHNFSGALSYDIPAPKSGLFSLLAGHWSVESVVVARSGIPFNAVVFGVGPQGGAVFTRPDLTGQSAWIQDSTAGGGKSLNPNAFSVPAT